MRLLATSLLAAVLSGSLTGCAALGGDSGGADGSSVVTAFYPLQYVAERVAGDLATVENLTEPGGEPHDLSLSVRQTAEVAEAGLVVYLDGFQPAVDQAVEQTAEGDTLDAGAVVELEPAAAGHEHEEGPAEDDGHAHESDGLDPHFWLDPLRMAALGDAVADTLAQIDPDGAPTYAANAEDLRADLEDLDEAYASGLATCERHTIVVSHDAFGYLGKYGLDMEPIAGLSPEAEPTPADLAHLQEVIEQDGIATVFSERLASPRLTETLATDMGVSTAVLDPIEGLTDETAGGDYLSLMEANLAALQQANGCST
jgi:zinc transport system substrate-binding protein